MPGATLGWIGLWLVVALLAWVLPGRSALALDIEFSGRPVKLDVLALYDRRREREPHLTADL